jgi:hypothetical protein
VRACVGMKQLNICPSPIQIAPNYLIRVPINMFFRQLKQIWCTPKSCTFWITTHMLSLTIEFSTYYKHSIGYELCTFTTQLLHIRIHPTYRSSWTIIILLMVDFVLLLVFTRREPPTMGKQQVNFITCGCESSAPFL